MKQLVKVINRFLEHSMPTEEGNGALARLNELQDLINRADDPNTKIRSSTDSIHMDFLYNQIMSRKKDATYIVRSLLEQQISFS